METQTILYLPYRTAKLKAKYPIVYPMSAIVNHEILDIRGMVYQKMFFFFRFNRNRIISLYSIFIKHCLKIPKLISIDYSLWNWYNWFIAYIHKFLCILSTCLIILFLLKRKRKYLIYTIPKVPYFIGMLWL